MTKFIVVSDSVMAIDVYDDVTFPERYWAYGHGSLICKNATTLFDTELLALGSLLIHLRAKEKALTARIKATERRIDGLLSSDV